MLRGVMSKTETGSMGGQWVEFGLDSPLVVYIVENNFSGSYKCIGQNLDLQYHP